MGAFPATLDDEETFQILGTFLGLGISTFVCLQAEFRLEEREADWRAGKGLRPYVHDATMLLSSMLASGDRRQDYLATASGHTPPPSLPRFSPHQHITVRHPSVFKPTRQAAVEIFELHDCHLHPHHH
jgi:hypothetical protein